MILKVRSSFIFIFIFIFILFYDLPHVYLVWVGHFVSISFVVLFVFNYIVSNINSNLNVLHTIEIKILHNFMKRFGEKDCRG